MFGRAEVPDLVASGCAHQWFEVGRCSRHLCEQEGNKCPQRPDMLLQCVNYEYGVQVGCANCNARRKLWVNGEIKDGY